MTLAKQTLLKCLYDSFPKIETDILFADALTQETWGEEEYDLNESWKNWAEISEELLDECGSIVVTFLCPDEFVMVLPRYLLEIINDGTETTNNISVAIDAVIGLIIDWIDTGVINYIFLNS